MTLEDQARAVREWNEHVRMADIEDLAPRARIAAGVRHLADVLERKGDEVVRTC
jgi:hypothetical protein